MHYERFVVEPQENTRDPLSLYFRSIVGFFGGGLTTFEFLDSTPKVIHLNLNEWVTFDRPGTYRVHVTSRRGSDTSPAHTQESFELTSNWIELKILLADPAWQRAQVAAAVRALKTPSVSFPAEANDRRNAALDQLRYLGTEDAARELARHLTGEDNHTDWQCSFGLIGSLQRDVALDEMNHLFDNPDFPVSSMFLTTMAILSLDPRAPPDVLRKKMQANREALNQRLALAMRNRHGAAEATSLDTLLASANPRTALPKEQIQKLIDVFPSLKIEEQIAWLEHRWSAIEDPEWIPLLRSLALEYTDFPQLRIMEAYQSLEVTGAALRHWYELDPGGARDAVINEILRPRPRYGAEILGLLPDRTLPAEQHQIAEHFLATDKYEFEGNLASLLLRYADSSVESQILEKISSKLGMWACDPEEKALAYLLRVDPAKAESLIENTMTGRGPHKTGCRHMLLTALADLQFDTSLEPIAIHSLSDSDPETAINAAEYLRRFGSAAAEQPLWDRYMQWSREWQGRESELRFVNGAENPNVWYKNLGEALARALSSGLGWLTDGDTLHRIRELAVGDQLKQTLDGELKAWSRKPWMIQVISTGQSREPFVYNMAQYDLRSLDGLKAKLVQLPRGTRLLWSPIPPSEGKAADKIFSETSAFAAQHGVQIERAPAPGVN